METKHKSAKLRAWVTVTRLRVKARVGLGRHPSYNAASTVKYSIVCWVGN